MLNRFPEYTADYIAGIMSLRKPQKYLQFIKIYDCKQPLLVWCYSESS